jgi:glycosyltransferase involved in cell wall biosynthesis
MQPLVSIVTPSFNQGEFLERTLRSVLFQDYPNIEYIVLDGGSADSSAEIIKRYAPWLAYWRSAPDEGQAAALAEGFARAQGEIVAYLNSDDMLAPGAVTAAVAALNANPEWDAVYSHRCFVDETDIVRHYWLLPPHCNWFMMRWDLIPQETCFWRRSTMERLGGIDPTLKFAMDYDLFLRIMRDGRMVRLNRFNAAFRWHASQKSLRDWEEVGLPEIRRVQARYGISVGGIQDFAGRAITKLINITSPAYGRLGPTLAGAPKGGGRRFVEVWRGALDATSHPTRRQSMNDAV